MSMVPSIHIGYLTTACNSSSALLASAGTAFIHMHIPPPTCTLRQMKIKIKKLYNWVIKKKKSQGSGQMAQLLRVLQRTRAWSPKPSWRFPTAQNSSFNTPIWPLRVPSTHTCKQNTHTYKSKISTLYFQRKKFRCVLMYFRLVWNSLCSQDGI